VPQVQKPEVRAAILAAALDAFAADGFDRASINGIARAAGVAPANIYRYFPTKVALFEAVLPDELIAEHDRLLDARVAALTTPGRPPDAAEELLTFWAEHRLAVATLLDHEGETSRSWHASAFVERMVASVVAALDGQVDAAGRELLTLVFDGTRRTLAQILRASTDPDDLRRRVQGFWSYQVPGLDGLIAWLRS
jgi:AcrR family transcriptional regulator